MLGSVQQLGTSLKARLSVWLGATRARRRWDPEIKLLPKLVAAGEAAVDIGANRGVYTWPLARLSREVFAVEPNPQLAARLRAAFGKRVHVLDCAFSDSEGVVTLWIPSHGGQDLVGRGSIEPDVNAEFDRRPVEVPVRTLDSLRLQDCGFIKAHVEGHEVAALEGARRTLERCHPTILVGPQVRFAADLPERVFALLSGLGYAGYFLDHGRLRPYRAFDPIVHQNPAAVPRPGDGKGLTADFIYNFIYIHPSRPEIRRQLEPLMSGEPEEPPMKRDKEPALAG
jgi:FkbM family methyltransferase